MRWSRELGCVRRTSWQSMRACKSGLVGVSWSMNTFKHRPGHLCGGDAIEVKDFVTGEPTQVPLAGPAKRQGRNAADHIFGRAARYRGTQGTAIVRVFDPTAAMTAASEKFLRRASRPYRKVYVHPDESRWLLPRCRSDDHQTPLRPGDGPSAGRAGLGRGRSGQADRRARHGDPGGHEGVQPRRDRSWPIRPSTARPKTQSTWQGLWLPVCSSRSRVHARREAECTR